MILPRLKENPNQPTFFGDLQLPPVLEVKAKPSALTMASRLPAAGETWEFMYNGHAHRAHACTVIIGPSIPEWDGHPRYQVAYRRTDGIVETISQPPGYFLAPSAVPERLDLAYYAQQGMDSTAVARWLWTLKRAMLEGKSTGPDDYERYRAANDMSPINVASQVNTHPPFRVPKVGEVVVVLLKMGDWVEMQVTSVGCERLGADVFYWWPSDDPPALPVAWRPEANCRWFGGYGKSWRYPEGRKEADDVA